MDSPAESAHRRAAEAFVQATRERFDEEIEAIHLFGSVARGEERGADSDVDLLVVLSDETDNSRVTDAIRDHAYEIELEYGVVISLVVRTQSELDCDRNRPFVRTVTRTGQTLYG
ncbi:nucleotidyltransferase domain-containing protein [Halovivax limisalsi]|uniref:nucleotidyltransferase domain-containing protein n=1 Tax=Halovivax limisalsi TaxID=1453760 RepID=UPI001FFCCFA2|nr:nucleotidyltransferase domain-containing protein [Halovivax limisalsi]